jgi:hypothetical protein
MAGRRDASGRPLTYRGFGWSKILDAMVGGSAAANGDLLYRAGGAWTRRAIGTAGQYLKAVSSLPTWSSSTAGGGGIGYVKSVYQAADLVITNATTGTTLVNTDLILPLDVGVYRFEFQNFCVSHATPDMKTTLNYTGTASLIKVLSIFNIEGNTNYFNDIAESFSVGTYTTTSNNVTTYRGTIFTTVAGDLRLQTAQNVASATPVTGSLRGSSAIVWQVG